MPAVSEKPEVKQPAITDAGDPIEQYQMPKPTIGSAVVFYKYGTKVQSRDPEIGFVLKAHARAIVIRTANGDFKGEVRHLADPKLQLSEEQRENGAWDFTEEYYLIRQLRAELEDVKKLLK